MALSCKPKKRIAIYSAVYGRTIDSQAVGCKTDTAVNYGQTLTTSLTTLYLVPGLRVRVSGGGRRCCPDCTVDVLPELMRRCHAQKDCSLNVEDALLGNPCPKGVSKYLTLIFMCGKHPFLARLYWVRQPMNPH